MRVLFFGMDGLFSVAPLRALCAARRDEIEIAAVVVPRPREFANTREPYRMLESPRRIKSELPLTSAKKEPNIIGLAFAANIPVVEIHHSLAHAPTLALLASFNADLICVACFSQIIPRTLLDLSGFGALNVHPSLLPAYRGPEPLFWIFHDGLEHAGVTIHLMNEQTDAGDIVAQERIELPDGVSYREAERICSEAGAHLLTNALRAMQEGKLMRAEQDNSRASFAPIPIDADFIVETNWSARRAFNFIRGRRAQDAAAWIRTGDELIRVRDAFAFDETERLDNPLYSATDKIEIQFSDVTLTIIPESQ